MLRTIIFIILAVAVLFLASKYLPNILSSDSADEPTVAAEAVAEESAMETSETNIQEVANMEAQTIKQDNGLEITTLKAGTGEGAVVGNSVTVHYVGTLTNGAKFDSSRDRNQPFTVVLGQNRVIPGWEQGLLGIKAGELRKLVIPSDLAYGPQELPGIPANSTLVFEIEALEIK